MSCLLAGGLAALAVLLVLVVVRHHRPPRRCGRRIESASRPFRSARKPAWVRRQIIHLKALMPDAGCRHIADIFNRRYGDEPGMTVGKTFVSTVIRHHQYEILVRRRFLRRRRPRRLPIHDTWALDLSGKADARGAIHPMLAVVEHASRACLLLERCRDRSSAALLLRLCAVVRQHGYPRAVRTDNEAIFTSRLFRFGLICLGIRHQRTLRGCPWMNGRVERFFGTLKQKLDRWCVVDGVALDESLRHFRFWYNHVRPHRNLDGRTPAEGLSGRMLSVRRSVWYEAWDGLLAGYHFRE